MCGYEKKSHIDKHTAYLIFNTSTITIQHRQKKYYPYVFYFILSFFWCKFHFHFIFVFTQSNIWILQVGIRDDRSASSE